MKNAFLLALFLVAICNPIGIEAVCDANGTPTNGDLTTMSITEIACDPSLADTFSTLCNLLIRTDLDETLSRRSTSDFFVFAPTNAAFVNARMTAGVSIPQITKTLQYHVSNDSSDLTCGARRDSLLTLNSKTRSSSTRCAADGTTLLGQTGNVRTPRQSSPLPNFVAPTAGNEASVTACNGKIRAIDQVLGFGPMVYRFGSNAPCSFYSKSCKAGKGGKAAKAGKKGKNYNYPVIEVEEETVDGVTFDHVHLYYGKSSKKKSKKDKGGNGNGNVNRSWNGSRQQPAQAQAQAQKRNRDFMHHPGLEYMYNRYFGSSRYGRQRQLRGVISPDEYNEEYQLQSPYVSVDAVEYEDHYQ